MTRTDLERCRETLLSLRRRMTGDVSHLTDEALRARAQAEGAGAPASSEAGAWGADTYEHEFTLALLHNQEQTLQEIAEALDRIDKGTFGRCEECGGAIPRGRLQALPYTRHCVSCARKLQ
jgi:RNA polymerase-binding transcription factor DksA